MKGLKSWLARKGEKREQERLRIQSYEVGMWNGSMKRDYSIEDKRISKLIPEDTSNDLSTALMFLDSLPSITLVVESKERIPYVLRQLYKQLGEPRKVWGTELFYGSKSIRVLSYLADEHNIRGIRHEQVFMVDTYEPPRRYDDEQA